MHQSYKIFVSDKPVLLVSPAQEIPSGYIELPDSFLSSPVPLLEDRDLWKKGEGFFCRVASTEGGFSKLLQNLQFIRAAGGIVWNEEDCLLMIHRRGYWDLPKGKIDENEGTEEAALREVQEECGVSYLTIQNLFGKTYHIYGESQWILKETLWYDMICRDSAALVPQEEEDITEAVWLPKSDVMKKLDKAYSSIREILMNRLS